MSCLDMMVAVFLGAWLIASAIYQFWPKSLSRISQLDVFHLLPKWTFFAPNPGHTDYHLLYRDLLTNDIRTDWNEVPLVQERSLLAAIWNPQKRLRKCLLDLTQSLIKLRSMSLDEENMIILSVPYLLLLNYVSCLGTPRLSQARQFIVFQTYGFFPAKAPELLIRSSFHDLDQSD